VNFKAESYKDTVEISTAELYQKVDELGVLPQTASPTPADFINAFKPYIDEGADIVYIGLSSQLSSTIQNAILAAQDFPEGRVNIIDSLNLSTGIGILVMKAADLKREGLSAYEIAQLIKQMIPKVRTAFTIDTFEYLCKGGRCTAIQGLIGGIFKIKPITRLVDGKIMLYDKQRGRKKALLALLQEIRNDKEILDDSRVFVTHSFAEEAAVKLKQELLNTIQAENILITNAGCVISSHCGKATIGIIYMIK
jgi:DegV family protein with EDD domain